MRILQWLRWFEVLAHVKNIFLFKPFRPCRRVSENFSCKFRGCVASVSVLNEFVNFLSVRLCHKENTSSMYSFDSSDLMLLWLKIIFYCAHENIGKSNCHFYDHCSYMRLKIVSSIKLEVIFFTNETKHFS